MKAPRSKLMEELGNSEDEFPLKLAKAFSIARKSGNKNVAFYKTEDGRIVRFTKVSTGSNRKLMPSKRMKAEKRYLSKK